MAGRVRIDVAERRSRLATRQHLAPAARASSALEVAEDMVGLHATDPVSIYLAAWSRVRGFETADLDRALYDERSLLKILGMRRTMFVVPVALAGAIQAACTETIARGERARLLSMIERSGIAPDPEPWLDAVEAETVAALRRLGTATASDLTKEVGGLREQIPFGAGKTWQGQVGVSTRLLFLLSAEGRIIRGRPKGTLVSSLYRWAPIDQWVTGGLPVVPVEEARTELVRRWLRAFGPGTVKDIQWWTGWTVAMVKKALAAVGAIEVDVEADHSGAIATGFVLADDVEITAAPDTPWVALLSALDPTTMGWQGRDWYLAPHRPRLFDTNGNAGPTIWLDGHVIGGWAQRKNGEIAVEILEDVGRDARALVDKTCGDLPDWLGALRFVPRFRTPLEKELIG